MSNTATAAGRRTEERGFRDYREAPRRVQQFYRANHENQTLAFVLEMKATYCSAENRRIEMGMWEMMEHLNSFVDDSDPEIVYPECFENNPDRTDPVYSTPNGIYEEARGLENVHLSFGHDEYLYHVVKDNSLLPEPALAMIRYHSFYAWHREGAYTHLTDEHDREMLPWVQTFNPYDLYSKGDERPDAQRLEPHYRELVQRYFPQPLHW